jgi:hypothetical protein
MKTAEFCTDFPVNIFFGYHLQTAAIDTSSCRHRRRSKNSCSLLSAPSEDRDWAALPHDTLFNAFLRLGSCEIMWGAEGVCKAWRRVALDEPKLWRRIHINAVPEWSSIDIAVHDAVDRSAGQSEAFSGPWNDESLLYLAERYVNPSEFCLPSSVSVHVMYADDEQCFLCFI